MVPFCVKSEVKVFWCDGTLIRCRPTVRNTTSFANAWYRQAHISGFHSVSSCRVHVRSLWLLLWLLPFEGRILVPLYFRFDAENHWDLTKVLGRLCHHVKPGEMLRQLSSLSFARPWNCFWRKKIITIRLWEVVCSFTCLTSFSWNSFVTWSKKAPSSKNKRNDDMRQIRLSLKVPLSKSWCWIAGVLMFIVRLTGRW